MILIRGIDFPPKGKLKTIKKTLYLGFYFNFLSIK
jgi:hypothetical protein